MPPRKAASSATKKKPTVVRRVVKTIITEEVVEEIVETPNARKPITKTTTSQKTTPKKARKAEKTPANSNKNNETNKKGNNTSNSKSTAAQSSKKKASSKQTPTKTSKAANVSKTTSGTPKRTVSKRAITDKQQPKKLTTTSNKKSNVTKALSVKPSINKARKSTTAKTKRSTSAKPIASSSKNQAKGKPTKQTNTVGNELQRSVNTTGPNNIARRTCQNKVCPTSVAQDGDLRKTITRPKIASSSAARNTENTTPPIYDPHGLYFLSGNYSMSEPGLISRSVEATENNISLEDEEMPPLIPDTPAPQHKTANQPKTIQRAGSSKVENIAPQQSSAVPPIHQARRVKRTARKSTPSNRPTSRMISASASGSASNTTTGSFVWELTHETGFVPDGFHSYIEPSKRNLGTFNTRAAAIEQGQQVIGSNVGYSWGEVRNSGDLNTIKNSSTHWELYWDPPDSEYSRVTARRISTSSGSWVVDVEHGYYPDGFHSYMEPQKEQYGPYQNRQRAIQVAKSKVGAVYGIEWDEVSDGGYLDLKSDNSQKWEVFWSPPDSEYSHVVARLLDQPQSRGNQQSSVGYMEVTKDSDGDDDYNYTCF